MKNLICVARLRSRLIIGRDAIFRPCFFYFCKTCQSVAEDGIDFLNYLCSNPASHTAKSCERKLLADVPTVAAAS